MLALVQFMLILDVTVVNVALPNIQKDLQFGPTGLAWVVDGYVLTAGGLLLLGGRLSDLVGRKRLFLIGVAIFGISSVTCGLAQNPAMLVTSRFIQGIGEALAAPAALGLVALLFPDPRERTKALGVWGGIAGLGGTLGTVISGLLTNIGASSWRWIFLINIPVAAFALVVVPAPRRREPGEARSGRSVRSASRGPTSRCSRRHARSRRDRVRHPARRPDLVGQRARDRRLAGRRRRTADGVRPHRAQRRAIRWCR